MIDTEQESARRRVLRGRLLFLYRRLLVGSEQTTNLPGSVDAGWLPSQSPPLLGERLSGVWALGFRVEGLGLRWSGVWALGFCL